MNVKTTLQAAIRSCGATDGSGEALQVSRRLGGFCRSREDGAGVALHEIKPLREILRMVGPRLLRDAKFRAEERRADLGDEFFRRVSVIAKPFAHVAGKPVSRAAPVHIMPISA